MNLNHDSKHILTPVSKYLLHEYKQTHTLLDEELALIFWLEWSPKSIWFCIALFGGKYFENLK